MTNRKNIEDITKDSIVFTKAIPMKTKVITFRLTEEADRYLEYCAKLLTGIYGRPVSKSFVMTKLMECGRYRFEQWVKAESYEMKERNKSA